jgi:hypothetical protein
MPQIPLMSSLQDSRGCSKRSVPRQVLGFENPGTLAPMNDRAVVRRGEGKDSAAEPLAATVHDTPLRPWKQPFRHGAVDEPSGQPRDRWWKVRSRKNRPTTRICAQIPKISMSYGAREGPVSSSYLSRQTPFCEHLLKFAPYERRAVAGFRRSQTGNRMSRLTEGAVAPSASRYLRNQIPR